MGTRPQSKSRAVSVGKSSRTSHTALTSNIEVNISKSELLSAAYKWRLRKEKTLFYFLLLLLSVSFTIGVTVMVYSADLYVKIGATAIISTIIRKGTNYLLSQGSKSTKRDRAIGGRGVAD
jgi:hypothetical protein